MDSDPTAAHRTRTFCPYVGSWEDSTVHYLLPGAGNACHVGESLSRVERRHQEAFCLTAAWATCPRYLERLAADEAARAASRSARRPSKAWRTLGVVILALVTLLAALLVGYSFLWPRVGAADRFSPGLGPIAATESPPYAPEVAQQAPDTSTHTTAAAASPTGEAPAATELASAPSPTETWMPTPSPKPTTVPSSTKAPTPLPTATPTSTQTPSPSPTETATPQPTRARRPAPTPTLLPPPKLVSPLEGEHFNRWDVVTLAWEAVGPLPAKAYYVPTVTYSHHGATWTDETPWTKALAWTLSEHGYLQFLTDDGAFVWSVQVMLQTGTDRVTKKPIGVPLSQRSATRVVKWGAQQLQPVKTPVPP